MELDRLVQIRRSIRAYDETRISEEEVRQIIRCAQLAPSWKNSQTGRYYVAVSDEAVRTVHESLPGFNQKSSANAAYIVSAFKTGISGVEGEEKDLWGAYDLGLQNAYLLLKASDMGYDTLIMGLRDTQALRAYFGIPEDEMIMPVIAIGKRAADPRDPVRKDLEEILKIR